MFFSKSGISIESYDSAMVDGKPVDAGVFDMNTTTGLLRMKEMKGATAFALPLNPEAATGSYLGDTPNDRKRYQRLIF